MHRYQPRWQSSNACSKRSNRFRKPRHMLSSFSGMDSYSETRMGMSTCLRTKRLEGKSWSLQGSRRRALTNTLHLFSILLSLDKGNRSKEFQRKPRGTLTSSLRMLRRTLSSHLISDVMLKANKFQ